MAAQRENGQYNSPPKRRSGPVGLTAETMHQMRDSPYLEHLKSNNISAGMKSEEPPATQAQASQQQQPQHQQPSGGAMFSTFRPSTTAGVVNPRGNALSQQKPQGYFHADGFAKAKASTT